MPPTWSRCAWSRSFLRLQIGFLLEPAAGIAKEQPPGIVGAYTPLSLDLASGTTFFFLGSFWESAC